MRILLWTITACMLGGTILGCNSNSENATSEASSVDLSTPLSDMRSAVRTKNWSKADLYSKAVLQRYSNDIEAIMLVAQVAHFSGRPEESADLLTQAIKLEDFANESRVKQCVVAMIGVGRLYDAIDLLEKAIQSHPDHLDNRRLLFDLCMGSEEPQRGRSHGHYLVRKRKFDLALLMDLTQGERRTADAKPMTQMVQRNPNDLRPMIAEARQHFDRREYEEATKLCDQILANHPRFAPAQLLLARCLTNQHQDARFEQWLAELPIDLTNEPNYWLSLGTYSSSKDDHAQASRAFWEAVRRDPDRTESWANLIQELQRVESDERPIWKVTIKPMEIRLMDLSKLQQIRDQFDRTGRDSRRTVSQMVDHLVSLGRLWEAEAWTAVAMSFPDDASTDIQVRRQSIIARLSADTPWQLLAGHAELSWDGSQLPLPTIISQASIAREFDRQKENLSKPDDQSSLTVTLVDEAMQRGIEFKAMPADDLDQPGILLYKTLGCGGAAIDFDLDGWYDLYMATAGGLPPQQDSNPNALYRNLGGQFQDVTERSATGDRGFGQGVAISDVNQDGFPDLLVLNYGPNTLYLNNGDGTFHESTSLLRSMDGELDKTAWSTCAAIADFNADGLCDLAIANYCAGLAPVSTPCGADDAGISHACSPMKFPALADQFYEGQPDGSFIEVTSRWNAVPEIIGRGLGMVAADFDGKAGVELYVANDMTSNHFWSPSKSDDGSFQLNESALPRGIAGDERMIAQGSMGVALGDFDNDHDADFYVTNFHGEYNSYYEQLEPGLWRDRTASLKLAAPTFPLVGFGTQAVDIDRDGQLELIVTNGHVDLFSREGTKADYAEPMMIFARNGDAYEVTKSTSRYLDMKHVGRGLWKLDVDQDQRVDLVVTHQTEQAALLMNRTSTDRHWLTLKLVGTTCDRNAVGAKVQVTSPNVSLSMWCTSGEGYFGGNEDLLRFGLGDSNSPVSVSVWWPDGTQDIFPDVHVDQTLIAVQHSALE